MTSFIDQLSIFLSPLFQLTDEVAATNRMKKDMDCDLLIENSPLLYFHSKIITIFLINKIFFKKVENSVVYDFFV